MRTLILAIGYSFDEYKAIQESFHTVDKDLELHYAESVDAARQKFSQQSTSAGGCWCPPRGWNAGSRNKL